MTITVRSTRHGPLLSDARRAAAIGAGGDAGHGLGGAAPRGGGADPTVRVALRWTALEPGRTADAVFALNRPATGQDFREAAALFEVPAQNMVYADVDGNIGYQSPGRIPVRGQGRRQLAGARLDRRTTGPGYVPFDELPTCSTRPQGYIVTANQAVVGPATRTCSPTTGRTATAASASTS